MLVETFSLLLLLLASFVILVQVDATTAATASATPRRKKILVVGSANADTFLKVARLPVEGENLTLLKGSQPILDVPGGKGCTQAVAASKLLRVDNSDNGNSVGVCFVGQFGNDAAGDLLRKTLETAGVDVSFCTNHDDLPSGRGYVFLTETGSVSAVVSGGSNSDGWNEWKIAWERQLQNSQDDNHRSNPMLDDMIDSMLDGTRCILLQREVPEYVNLLIASKARARGGIIVIQDVGGEDRPISQEMLQCCDYIIPNESELARLVRAFQSGEKDGKDDGDDNLDSDNDIVNKAKILQSHGARNVLVTTGSTGSTLICESGEIIHQPAFSTSPVVDETGAGDCYRSAFAVALLEGHSLHECMKFASAAGSCAVEKNGAVPSTPSLSQVEKRLVEDTILSIPRGDGQRRRNHPAVPRSGSSPNGFGNDDDDDRTGNTNFPFLIGSRLNSMKDRPELWPGPLKEPRHFVQRQATVHGLTCVDFNYPQHFGTWWTNQEAKAALQEAGLVAGAVCLRYPSESFARGAMNHPDPKLRRQAIELTKRAAQTAIDLGCDEVVVWSAYDGYDYPFQVNYDEKWDQLVAAFQECCDSYPSIKFSLEYKPTDENTRFFTVPTTAAALQLVNEIDRPNMGLTLDVGHMLMAGENPGHSIAMVGRKKKLFGIQLNDGFTRLAAEDGLMFGSVHPSMALEIMYQMRRIGFDGHFYFDTFPQRTDPTREAEYNIRQLKQFWKAAGAIDEEDLKRVADEHDAIGALEIVNAALRRCS